MPQSGSLFIVHAIILSIKWIRKYPVAFFVMLIIGGSIGTATWNVFASSLEHKSTLATIEETWSAAFSNCEDRIVDKNINNVILRLDDIQLFTWGGVTETMIEDTLERDIPLSLGVIPMSINRNPELVSLIKLNECNVEIVLHGWNHREDVPEFSGIDEDTALDKLVRGKEYLEDLFDTKIVTFVPPQNEISKAAKGMIGEAGLRIYSGEGTESFDYDAETFNVGDGDYSAMVAEVLEDCQTAFDGDNQCVIMLHPQDFATDYVFDKEKYLYYLTLLDELKKMEVSFSTFADTLN